MHTSDYGTVAAETNLFTALRNSIVTIAQLFTMLCYPAGTERPLQSPFSHSGMLHLAAEAGSSIKVRFCC